MHAQPPIGLSNNALLD